MSPLPEIPQLNRDYARLLLVMRKLIRNEFEVTIPLDRPETTILLLHYARRSADTMLHEMAKELEELLAQPQQSATLGQAHEAPRYRGAVIASPPPNKAAHTEGVTWYRGVPMVGEEVVVPHREEKQAKRIYRGQVIDE